MISNLSLGLDIADGGDGGDAPSGPVDTVEFLGTLKPGGVGTLSTVVSISRSISIVSGSGGTINVGDSL